MGRVSSSVMQELWVRVRVRVRVPLVAASNRLREATAESLAACRQFTAPLGYRRGMPCV